MPIPPLPGSSASTPCPAATLPSSLLPSQPAGCHPLEGGEQKVVREEMVLAAFFTVDEENKHGLGKPQARRGLNSEFTEEQVAELGLYSKSGRKYGQ